MATLVWVGIVVVVWCVASAVFVLGYGRWRAIDDRHSGAARGGHQGREVVQPDRGVNGMQGDTGDPLPTRTGINPTLYHGRARLASVTSPGQSLRSRVGGCLNTPNSCDGGYGAPEERPRNPLAHARRPVAML